MTFTVGELFAGIGGMGLGLSRAGMVVDWQVEIDPFCRKVLEKNFPDARRWGDVKTFPPAEDWKVSMIAGGFPCQPVSIAGKKKGQDDERWLWDEMRRVCEVVGPEWVLVENVPGLLSAGNVRGSLFGGILRDLAQIGYGHIEWHCLSANAVACAPHIRDRVWICATRSSDGPVINASNAQHDGSPSTPRPGDDRGVQQQSGRSEEPQGIEQSSASGGQSPLPGFASDASSGRGSDDGLRSGGEVAGGRGAEVDDAHAPSIGCDERGRRPGPGGERGSEPPINNSDVPDANGAGCSEQRGSVAVQPELSTTERSGGWSSQCRLRIHPDGFSGGLDGCGGWECGVPRLAKGQKDRVSRLRSLGNAVVPQVVQFIGEQIMARANQ